MLVYEQWKSVGTKNWNDQKAVLTGYTALSDRYWASLHVRDAPDVPSANWNDQKKVLTGYTQPGNKYFATRQRLAYHPRDKTFLTPGTGTSTSSTQKAPPPPPKPAETAPPPPPPKSTKEQSFDDFEKEYLVRHAKEQEEKAKQKEAKQQSQASTASKKGAMPKGF